MGELLAYIVLGGLMGLLGQGARAVIGLKSMSDDAKALDLSPNDLFEAGRLITSCLIGFLVGIAAGLITLKGGDATNIPIPGWQTLLAWVAAGYAGTDFLEGFISQYLPAGAQKPKIQAPPAADIVKPQVQQPPPTFTQNQAWSIAEKAFADRGFTVSQNQPNQLLSDLGLTGFKTLHDLLVAVNDQIAAVNNKYGLTDAVAIGWQNKKTTVSTVVNAIEYAPIVV